MDGKTMRGTLGHEAPTQESVHLLSLSEVGTGTMLAQRAVATKENESSAAPLLVTPELLKGRIYSADALPAPVTKASGPLRRLWPHQPLVQAGLGLSPPGIEPRTLGY